MLGSIHLNLSSRVRVAVVGSVFASAGIAQANVVNYGNFVGPNLTYNNVSETDTQLPGPTPPALFGAPLLAADTLTFDPLAFVVSASGGSTEFQDGRLTIQEISPTVPGGSLSLLSMSEGGAWSVMGGTALTLVQESLIVNQVFINQVNGVAVNPIVVVPTFTFSDNKVGTANLSTTTSGGTADFEVTSAGSIASGGWDITATFNLNAALAAANLTGKVTGVNEILDNQLTASSEVGSSSFIDKKFFDVGVAPYVPEPAPLTVGLVVGACGILSRRHRSRTVAR